MLSVLQVETTSICNAHCVFCPHDKMESIGTMHDDLYLKILMEAKELQVKAFIPMLTGEPFCDRKIIFRLKLAREYLPSAVLLLFTNGSLIRDGQIESLATIQDLGVIVSLNGACPETRKRLMGLDDYWEVARKVREMAEAGIDVKPTMVMHPSVEHGEVVEFATIWDNLIKYQNFAGEIYPGEGIKGMSCGRAMSHMTIMWDGRVNLCCFDPLGKVVFGDVNKESIAQIWNSEARQAYIKAHEGRRGEAMNLCQSCTEPQGGN